MTTMQTRSHSSGSSEHECLSHTGHSIAFWTDEEEAALIQFLFEQRGEVTANSSFKKPVFGDVARHLRPLHKKGATKTADMCKTKWNKV